MPRYTEPQRRLIAAIRAAGDYAEYWPIMNDWVRDAGPARSLALHNINRTVDTLIRRGIIALDHDGLLTLTDRAPQDDRTT
jgi:hypothetical protein